MSIDDVANILAIATILACILSPLGYAVYRAWKLVQLEKLANAWREQEK